MTRSVYLEEEQMTLLGKMIVRCAGDLTPREREVYEKLVDSLRQRVERRRRLEGRNGEATELKAPKRVSRFGKADLSEEQEIYRVKIMNLRHLSAPEVVRTFIECWNTGDFEMEYVCLSKNFPRGGRQNTDIIEYAERRRRKYEVRESSNCVEKRIEKIELIQCMGARAEVDAVEVYIGATEETNYQRDYQLVYEEGTWRIVNFTDKSVNVNRRTVVG